MGIGRNIALVTLSLIFVIGFASNSSGQSSIVVTTDKASYSEGETIRITGEVSQLLEGYSLAVTVIAPNGDLVSIDQITVGNDKKFGTSLSAGGSLMKDKGTYTVIAQYGDNKNNFATTSFEFGGSTSTSGQIQNSITVSTDKSEYKEGDTIKISGQVETFLENWPPVTITIIDPTGEVVIVASDQPQLGSGYSVWLTAGEDVNVDGEYTVNVFYNTQSIAASTTFQYEASGSKIQSTCDLNSPDHPTVVLDIFRSNQLDGLGQIQAGETIVLTGRLVCESGYKHSNVEIIIFKNRLIDSDETLVTTYTDTNGEFSVPWLVTTDNTLRGQITTIQAKYETGTWEEGGRYAPVSDKRQIQIERQLAGISLDPLPKSAEIGEMLFFTGKLELESGSPEGYIIYIKDEDPFDADDLLATGYVESDGSFSANWIVTITDDDRIVDVYAVFEGGNIYWRTASCDYTSTGQISAGCRYTVPLTVTGERPPFPPLVPMGPLDSDNDGIPDDKDQCTFTSETYNGYLDWDGCPDTKPIQPKIVDSDGDGINDNFDSCPYVKETYNGYQDHDGCPDTIPKPIPKEKLSGDEYMRLYFSHSFTKNPVVAIVPAPDSYDEVRKYIIPSQEGVVLWGSDLSREYGGDWNVEFIIIDPSSDKFQTKPDIILNLVTREVISGCGIDFGGYASISTSRPVNTVVCTSGSFPYSTSQVSSTSSHEFVHAIGLGHTFNKKGDLMCSIEGGKPTCSDVYNRSKTPSDFNLASVAKLYGRDGYEIPNNCPDRSCDDKFSAEQYMNFDYTPPTTPEPTKPKAKIDMERQFENIPEWVKNNAKWWANDAITQNEFLQAVEFLIKQKILIIPDIPTSQTTTTSSVPEWVKNNARWWANDAISDSEFVAGIQYLIGQGLIRVS